MRGLSKDFIDDQRLGLNLLRFSSEAIADADQKTLWSDPKYHCELQLQRTQGNALMQTLLPNGEGPRQSAEYKVCGANVELKMGLHASNQACKMVVAECIEVSSTERKSTEGLP